MFEPRIEKGHLLGHGLQLDGKFFFFGAAGLDRKGLPDLFPEFQFRFLKQVHGVLVVEASSLEGVEADAHHTRENKIALVSQTADCVPVLLASATRVCAVHAGWKSAALGIVGQAARAFTEPITLAAIGPHIMRESFEVGRDVAEKLLASVPSGANAEGLVRPHADDAKVYFDLTELVRRQIHAVTGPTVRVLEHLADTQTDRRYHSFRRDRERAGRQHSFVVLNPSRL